MKHDLGLVRHEMTDQTSDHITQDDCRWLARLEVPAPVLLHTRTMHLLALLTLARAAAAQFPRQSSSCALMMPSYSHQTCISYEDVNAAFHEARNKFGLPPVEKKFGIADVTLVVDVSNYYFQSLDDSRLAISEE